MVSKGSFQKAKDHIEGWQRHLGEQAIQGKAKIGLTLGDYLGNSLYNIIDPNLQNKCSSLRHAIPELTEDYGPGQGCTGLTKH
jgi:hypothetical protein